MFDELMQQPDAVVEPFGRETFWRCLRCGGSMNANVYSVAQAATCPAWGIEYWLGLTWQIFSRGRHAGQYDLASHWTARVLPNAWTLD